MRNPKPARSQVPPDAAERRLRLRQLLAGYQASRALLAADEFSVIECVPTGG